MKLSTVFKALGAGLAVSYVIALFAFYVLGVADYIGSGWSDFGRMVVEMPIVIGLPGVLTVVVLFRSFSRNR